VGCDLGNWNEIGETVKARRERERDKETMEVGGRLCLKKLESDGEKG